MSVLKSFIAVLIISFVCISSTNGQDSLKHLTGSWKIQPQSLFFAAKSYAAEVKKMHPEANIDPNNLMDVMKQAILTYLPDSSFTTDAGRTVATGKWSYSVNTKTIINISSFDNRIEKRELIAISPKKLVVKMSDGGIVEYERVE